MKRKIMLAVATAVAVAAGVFIAAAGTANATAIAPPVCPTWQVRSITLDHESWDPQPVAGSGIIDANTVRLVKPAAGNAGTEASTSDAGIDVGSAHVDITVDYQLNNGASFAAGAVRLFYYHLAGSNTLTDAPTDFVWATANSGTLTIHNATGQIGTLGVVYDASNSAGGDVTFSNLKVGNVPVKFTDDECQSPSPSPTLTHTVSPSPTPTTTTTPAPVPTTVVTTVTVTG